MANLSEPYVIHYPKIVAVADETGMNVELIEFFDCIGGAMWSGHHYAQSPIVTKVRCVGSTMRYLLKTGSADLLLEGSRFPAGISACIIDGAEIAITYIGMGGGGVGAAACRTDAAGVLRSRSDPAGGGKVAGAIIWLPRMQRVLIGVDDTDTPEEGATWTLVHNISRAVEDEHSVYLSHTIVQLFPVPTGRRTASGWLRNLQRMILKDSLRGSASCWNGIPFQRRPAWRSIPVSLLQKSCSRTEEKSSGGKLRPA